MSKIHIVDGITAHYTFLIKNMNWDNPDSVKEVQNFGNKKYISIEDLDKMIKKVHQEVSQGNHNSTINKIEQELRLF